MIIIPIKLLFHWEYTLFSDKPIYWKIVVWGGHPQIPSCCEQNLYQGFDPLIIASSARFRGFLSRSIPQDWMMITLISRSYCWNGCFKHQRNTGLNVSGCSLMVIVYVLICFSLGWWSPVFQNLSEVCRGPRAPSWSWFSCAEFTWATAKI